MRKISRGTIATFAGKNSCGFNGDGHAATSAVLPNSGGVSVDGSGNVYIADTDNCRYHSRFRRTVSASSNKFHRLVKEAIDAVNVALYSL